MTDKMTQYRIHDVIKTLNGTGTVQWCTGDQVKVWILQTNWRPCERYPDYPRPFTAKSPTVSAIYDLEEVVR